ncbi:hypothetical protein QVD99_002897 [Batrachochytrium dendrobatidis]|nr:hypothetical protein O5D80_003211 [Batrachochytrium dendrobatidis]KAK5671136.1 hypothetical protein QVD99_002897 [Batrachochytrium dendrobatidis]
MTKNIMRAACGIRRWDILVLISIIISVTLWLLLVSVTPNTLSQPNQIIVAVANYSESTWKNSVTIQDDLSRAKPTSSDNAPESNRPLEKPDDIRQNPDHTLNEGMPNGLKSPIHYNEGESPYSQFHLSETGNSSNPILPIDGYNYDNYIRIKKWPRRKNAYFLVVTTMIHNKARFVPEWIEFHLLQGFDRFVIYDDASTDGLKAILDPYIQMDVVEYIRWPEDGEAVHNSEAGPRVFDTKFQQDTFNTMYKLYCLNRPKRGSLHAHGGCQKSSAIDTIARYRHKSVWVLHADIDEFFYSRKKIGQSGLDGIVTVRDILAQNYYYYDQIVVQGHIFGTSGFMDDPTPVTKEMPFPMVMEQYRHRRSYTSDRNREAHIRSRIHCEKAFVKAYLPAGTWVHSWYFDKNAKVRSISSMESVLTMNHYQYRSILGQNRKAAENSNYNIEYDRPADQFLMETKDYGIGYLAPLVRHNLQQRINDNLFPELPSLNYFQPTRKPRVNSLVNKQVDICIAVTHFNGELPQLRKTIHSIQQFLNIVDKNITYKWVFVSQRITSVGDDKQQESVYFKDFYNLLDEVKYVSRTTTLAQMIDIATHLCGTNAEFILYLEDMWETRFRVPGRKSAHSTIVQKPVFKEAMDLMRQDTSILEVWMGDTPHNTPYTALYSDWLPISSIAHSDNPSNTTTNSTTISSSRWYRKNFGNEENPHSVTRLGGTLRHRLRQKSVGSWATFDTDPNHNPLTLTKMYGQAAMKKNLSSAQICYGDSQKTGGCQLDSDHTNDGAITGIMWRQRLVLNKEKGLPFLFDRPLK